VCLHSYYLPNGPLPSCSQNHTFHSYQQLIHWVPSINRLLHDQDNTYELGLVYARVSLYNYFGQYLWFTFCSLIEVLIKHEAVILGS